MRKPVEIAKNLYLIDGFDTNLEERTGIYVIKDEKIAVIETSASASVPYILEGLKALEIAPEEVDYLIVTHIHLDHAGGAGLFLQHAKNAKFYVHPSGARHMIDPSRLIESAKSVYGEQFETFFNPIVPIEEERVVQVEHGDTLPLGTRTFTFYHTPGHARHHISIYDDATNGMFTGDTAGVRFPIISKHVELVLPSTSPNQYDPEAMLTSIDFFEQKKLDTLYFGHYGAIQPPAIAYDQIRYWTPIFVKATEQACEQSEDLQERCQKIEDSLYQAIENYTTGHGYPNDIRTIVKQDVEISTLGLIDYYTKKSKN